jgi:hypothetical protein
MSGPAGEPLDDRRAAILAAVLVGAVVLVLGFGSGIGSVLSREAKSGSSSGGRDLGTVVQGGDVALGTSPGAAGGMHVVQPISSVTAGASDAMSMGTSTDLSGAASGATQTAGSATPTTLSVAPTASGSTTTTTAAAGTASVCPTGGVAYAALTPFLVHLDKAHLETSPGTQAAQALDVDQYVKTHTVLVEAILQPVVDTVLGALQALPPFWSHLDKAHLEESPGTQVAQALDVDQYVKTHTVLVENMLAPAMADVTGAGCGG